MGRLDYQDMEEKEVIGRAQHGDSEATSFLLEKYKGIVRRLSHPLFLVDGDQDDLLQEGMIGLFKAIQSFDNAKGAGFETYASVCISRHLYTAIEKSNRKKNIPLNSYISIYSLEYPDEMEERDRRYALDKLLADWQKNPEEIVIKKEDTQNVLQNIFQKLSKMEKEVLRLFLKGMTYQEIAKQMDCAPKKIDNALQRIKMKIAKKHLHS